MKAIWLVRWQEIAGRIRFWTAIIGYDPRDRSIQNSIYLLYVVIFFSIWGFAVLSLLADFGSGILRLAEGLAPSMAAVEILMAVLVLTVCVIGYQAGVRSPFVFSDTDAELICQTPVKRSQVALAWFLGDWFSGGLLFTALVIVLSFANLQLSIPGGFTWAQLPASILAGIKAASIALPMHMAFTSLLYALGALRLRGSWDKRWLRWVPLLAGVTLLMFGFGKVALARSAIWPVKFPLQAAIGVAHWIPGFITALLWNILGLVTLYVSSRDLNLSRAAQESRSRWAMRHVTLFGGSGLSQAIKLRQKLGFGHAPSRIPSRQGIFSLLWKAGVVTTRTFQFSSIFSWVGIFAICLVMLLATDWGTRLWSFVIWSLVVARRGTAGLRSDLEVWSLTRQLPFSTPELLYADCLTPGSALILVSWLSLAVSYILGSHPPLFLILVLPAATLCIVISAVFDLIRQSHTSELLAGQVAEPGAVGLVIGLVVAGVPVLLAYWLVNLFPAQIMLLPISTIGLGIAAAGIYGMGRLAYTAYKKIN